MCLRIQIIILNKSQIGDSVEENKDKQLTAIWLEIAESNQHQSVLI
jgi:hypothetical protein